MRILILGVLLTSTLFGAMFEKKWEYLLYYQGSEYDSKTKTINRVNILNDGTNVGVGTKKSDKESKAEMLKKYLSKYDYKEAYLMDVLRALGERGWEMVSIEKEKGNVTYFFKR